MKKFLRVTSIILCSTLILAGLLLVVWLKVLPKAVSNPELINFAQKKLEETTGVKSVIVNPVLKTDLSPVIEFSVDNVDLSDESGKIINVNNFATVISFKEILSKNIIIKKLGADFIYADINKLSSLSFKQEKQKQKSDWNIDIFDSVLYVKKSLIVYKTPNNADVKLTANDLKVDNTQKVQRFLHFNLTADIEKADKKLHFNIKDNNTVFFKDNHFHVEKCFLDVNKSKIFFNVNADRKKNFNAEIYSDKIDVKDVLTLIDSQIIENNINESLSYFSDLDGSFNFNIKLSNNDISGVVGLNKIFCKIILVNNIPLTLEQGKILLNKKTVTLKDIKGFYGYNKVNSVTMDGTVDDYLKTIDTKLIARAVVTNEFMKNYLSKMLKTPIELTGGTTKTRLDFKSINNKIDMNWYFGLREGQDILLDGASFSPVEFARGVKSDMHFENNLLTIKSLDYYIVPERLLKGEHKIKKLRPILKFFGNIDVAKGSLVKDLGFSISEEMPSEFLNLLIGDKFFKKGKVFGTLKYDNTGNYPILDGNLVMDKVAIPSQRIFVKHGEINTTKGLVNISAQGGYRRSKFDINGDIANEVKFPVVVKNLDLTVDNIDIEKFLASANNQKSEAITSEKFDFSPSGEAKNDDDDTPTFDIGNFVVENCLLKVNKGNYKNITFSDAEANLTLDKNSVLKLNSNTFNIANGQSSAKVDCNLKKHKYAMILDIKDVDSDLLATDLLMLPREISGKASGLIDFNTDNSLKLNGKIKFDIKDGTIQKIGFVEYILKVAALFRNPLTMISPSTVSDLINVPEGNFDKINGTLVLKNNVIERMMIRSSAPQLSSFIVGSYNLENSDATLRIYTKFSNRNKGLYGLLRNISLNSLANRIPLTSKNDSNYYSAELSMLPPIDADEKDCQVFLTKVDGDIEHNNFISSLKKIK